MRSERSRSSRASTKPAISAFQAAVCSTGCAIRARFAVAARKPADAAATASASGKATARLRARTAPATHEERSRRPRLGLPVGGEVQNDPEAEGDGEPGNEPPGSDVGQRPRAQAFADRVGKTSKPVRPRHRLAAGGRPPRCFPSARDTVIDHCAVPPDARATSPVAMLHRPRPVHWGGPRNSHGASHEGQGPFAPDTFAQVSRSPTVRLNTSLPGCESWSGQK